MENVYPLSPTDLPKKLTKLPGTYKLKASLAILSVLLFFVLYFALVAGSAWLMIYAVFYEIEDVNKGTILLKLGAIAGSIMLFVFTFKFLVKLKNPSYENRVKLDRNEYPELFAFVEKICAETGAPKPKNIYADPDVNAYVSYSNMWLSLIFPVKKNLTIGLGLVNSLNMLEFKAVISHEFGHFSQRSMKIGSYIVSANTIIHDMIFTRDKWDNVLVQWRSADLRLSFAAWIVTPVIWLLRQTLSLFYLFLNIMYSSLSREMEFNADKVAVSTSGSEAIVTSLWRLEHGSQSWDNTMNDAYLAAQKKMYTRNLYAHNAMANNRARVEHAVVIDALPDDTRGGKKYFSGSENSKVNMYSSHPPNDQRENNAKVPFVACTADERSPWILFNQPIALQEKLTDFIYKSYLQVTPSNYVTFEEFEDFVHTESAGKELMAAYENTFENRFLNIPGENETVRTIQEISGSLPERVKALKQELHVLMQPVRELESMMEKATGIANGTLKDKTLSYKDVTYNRKSMEQVYRVLFNDREKLFQENFIKWDIDFCTVHLALAKQQDKYTELRRLYNQHNVIMVLYRSIITKRNEIFTELNALQSRDDVMASEIADFSVSIVDRLKLLNDELAMVDERAFVPMPNISNVEEFKTAIVPGGKFPLYKGNVFDSGDFDHIATLLQNAGNHCQRLDQKSIGCILGFHEELVPALP